MEKNQEMRKNKNNNTTAHIRIEREERKKQWTVFNTAQANERKNNNNKYNQENEANHQRNSENRKQCTTHTESNEK